MCMLKTNARHCDENAVRSPSSSKVSYNAVGSPCVRREIAVVISGACKVITLHLPGFHGCLQCLHGVLFFLLRSYNNGTALPGEQCFSSTNQRFQDNNYVISAVRAVPLRAVTTQCMQWERHKSGGNRQLEHHRNAMELHRNAKVAMRPQ